MNIDFQADLRRAVADLKFSASNGSGVDWIGATADIADDPMRNDCILGAQKVHEDLHPEKRGNRAGPLDEKLIDAAEAAYDQLAAALKGARGHKDVGGLAAIDRNYRLALFNLLVANIDLDPEFLQWVGRV